MFRTRHWLVIIKCCDVLGLGGWIARRLRWAGFWQRRTVIGPASVRPICLSSPDLNLQRVQAAGAVLWRWRTKAPPSLHVRAAGVDEPRARRPPTTVVILTAWISLLWIGLACFDIGSLGEKRKFIYTLLIFNKTCGSWKWLLSHIGKKNQVILMYTSSYRRWIWTTTHAFPHVRIQRIVHGALCIFTPACQDCRCVELQSRAEPSKELIRLINHLLWI